MFMLSNFLFAVAKLVDFVASVQRHKTPFRSIQPDRPFSA